MENGWICVHRKLLESEVFHNPNLLKVWLWCLLRANHKEKFVPFTIAKATTAVHVQPGQFVFGRHSAANELDMHPSTVRNLIQKLKTIGNLDIQSNRHFSIISIVKWHTYQDVIKNEDNQKDNHRTAIGQPQDTDNNVTMEQEKHIVVFEQWNQAGIIIHRKLTDSMKSAINRVVRDGCTVDDIITGISNYAQVLKSPCHYFKHKWTLQDFLKRGLSKFLDAADPVNNFRARKNGSGNQDSRVDEALRELG